MVKNKIKQKILVTDDEHDLILFFSAVLSDEFDLLSTSSGEEAIELIQSVENIDIALIDYKLPDMSGLTVLAKVKLLKPSLPVIIVTGFGDEDIAVKSFRLGAIDYIKKPFSVSELVGRINFYLTLKSNKAFPRKKISFDEENVTINMGVTRSCNIYKIQKAIKFIRNNYMSQLALPSLAKIACMSVCHFSRTFKLVVGVGYQEYLNRLRIEKAKELLQKTQKTVTEICLTVGYNDLTHFGRTFKRLTGLAPVKYKMNNANSKESRNKKQNCPRLNQLI